MENFLRKIKTNQHFSTCAIHNILQSPYSPGTVAKPNETLTQLHYFPICKVIWTNFNVTHLEEKREREKNKIIYYIYVVWMKWYFRGKKNQILYMVS